MSQLSSIDFDFRAKTNVLASMVMLKFDDLIEKLEINLTPSGSKYVGCCPIHCGDNETAFNIYYDGDTVPGYWVCRTKRCETKFRSTVIGFTRGVLSRQELDYHPEYNPNAIVKFTDSINYLCNFLGIKFRNIKYDISQAERAAFIAECKENSLKYISNKKGIPRDKVRANLIIPAPYYLNRNYSSNVLNRYDVGMSKTNKQGSIYRVIVPIYNDMDLMCGYSSRSIFEMCSKCRLFHKPETLCPATKEQKNLCSKWRHEGFESKLHLYNYHSAKKYIKESNVAILVEGPGDVWRLEEAGIHNSVAMFGVNLSSAHQTLLAQAQCMSIVCLLDNDEAGQIACKKIKEEYGRLFRMYFPRFNKHDMGDMNTDAITSEIKPLLRKIENV